MKLVLLTVALLGVVGARLWNIPVDDTVLDREHEPDNSEYFTLGKQDLVRQFCLSVRRFQEELIGAGSRPRNTVELSNALVMSHDSNRDNCISDGEIRSLAERFGADITAYRILFENVLDETQNGCVEAKELNALILDCIMPSARWMERVPNKYEIPFDEEEQHRELQRLMGAEEAPEEEEEEEEKVDVTLEEMEMNKERTDRRAMLEKEKPQVKEEPILHSALKELLCSLVKRQNEDLETGFKELIQATSLDDDEENLNYHEIMEILSSARIGEEESMDIAGLLDTNKDHIVTYEEFYGALDGCPRPDIIQPIPVVDTRPIINTQDKPCPDETKIYNTLRNVARKFIGGTQLSFDGVKDAAIAMYTQITGDIENGMLPKDLDIPNYCIKECFAPLDGNGNGKLDQREFEQIAFDVLEEFIPRPKVNKLGVKDSRVIMNGGNSMKPRMPREHLEVLNEATYNTLKMLGRRVPESDLRSLVHTLSQNPLVKEFLAKVQGTVGDEAVARLQDILKSIIMNNLWTN